MQEIAKLGGGEAYPMSTLDYLADAFSMAHIRLQSVVAQNITLTLRPRNGARIVDLRSAGIVEEIDESMSRYHQRTHFLTFNALKCACFMQALEYFISFAIMTAYLFRLCSFQQPWMSGAKSQLCAGIAL